MKKTIGILIGVFILCMSMMTGFAEIKFSDVPDGHWAKPYIANMASKNIIKGEVDNATLKIKFRPEDNVTYVESIQMIYNLLRETNHLDKSVNISDTKALLSSSGIPTWAHEAVGYSLKKGILMNGDLLAFTKSGQQVPAKKQDIAIFIGKALNKKTQAFPTKIYNFVDAETIKSAAVPYVDLLVREGIVKGDSQNKFNPNSNVTRAVMATMCSNTYDVMIKDTSNNTSTDNEENTDKEEVKEEEKDIKKVIYVAEDIDRVVVSNDKGTEQVYDTKKAKIYKNGKEIDLDDLKSEDEVTLEFEGSTLKKIEVVNGLIEYEGKVESIEDEGAYYKLVTRDRNNLVIKKEFKIYEDTDIYIGNNKVSVGKIKENEYVYIEYKGSKIEKIDLIGSGKKVEMDGILVSEVQFKEYPVLKFKINTGDILEYEIDDDADIERDDDDADLDELKKGDIVTVEIYKNKIEDIEATSIKEDGDDEGIIKELIIGSPSKITIQKKDKELKTYEVAENVDVEIDREDKDFGDLKLNYYVEIEIENGEVTEIEAEEGYQNESITGEVTKVYKDYDRLSVKYYKDKENEYDKISIVVTDETTIIDEDGDKSSRISTVDEDDNVFIDGYYDDDLFIAQKILILGSN
ncbi:S-layer homology domain-containing protein [Anaeromicrobium sediminis]|uniref:S-layer homology domain-containing protein n=1 Tax=Anaeromicrobium sediminis TaxID=1478221 RepID=UPI00159632C7|nr:S-layer homology domain-containing protein [Anaeromicrobium sediminis]